MRPSEIPQLVLLRSSKIPCSSTGSLANGCTYRGIIGIIPTFTGQKTYNPIPLKKENTPRHHVQGLFNIEGIGFCIYVQPKFHHTTKLRNKTSYEAPAFHTSGTRGTFHTQFWLTAIYIYIDYIYIQYTCMYTDACIIIVIIINNDIYCYLLLSLLLVLLVVFDFHGNIGITRIINSYRVMKHTMT